jgi:rare lipoprotein A (peptidoglycan hydrolase)
MTSSLGLRAAGLAGVALVALAVALAYSAHHTKKSALPTPAGQWYTALAAPYTPTPAAKKGACGVVIGPKTMGVGHPVLPCGAKIFVKLGDKEVLTQVVDRGHTVPGRDFDVTVALAKLLDLRGTESIQWRFAR